MPEHVLMIPFMVPRFFPTPYNDNKLESSLAANAFVGVEAFANYGL